MARLVKAIRAAIRDRIQSGRTAAGERVSTNRGSKVWSDGLPAIVIHTLSEEFTEDDNLPTYRRKPQVVIDLLLQELSGLPLDDDCDDLQEEVERLMFRDPRLSKELGLGVIKFARPVRWDTIVQEGSENLIAGARWTWEYEFFQEEPEGDMGELVPLKEINTSFEIVGGP